MKPGISASLMCINFADTKTDLAAMEAAGIDYLHFDIMDGAFVPNYALGVCMIDKLRGKTSIPFDIHLMVERPELKIPYFSFKEGDAVSVHAESTVHLERVLQTLRSLGCKAGVALNPATPIDVLEYVLCAIDFVLIMTVNPGYAGQKLVEATLPKITATRKYLDSRGKTDVVIQVDGNVSFDNAERMAKAGAANYVVGTAGFFRNDMSMQDAAKELRKRTGV